MSEEPHADPWHELLDRYLPAFLGAWSDARAGTDPFATVTMAYLQARDTREDPDVRYWWKMAIWRHLCESGHEPAQLLDLFAFVDQVLRLPPELEARFADTIEEYEEEKKMHYVTTFERRGIEKGILRGGAALLKRQLQRRFARLPAWAEELLDRATREQLELWADRLFDARRLECVFA